MFRIILNLSVVAVGLIYFALYYLFDYDVILFNYFVRFSWGKVFFSIVNWLLGALLLIWIIALLNDLFRRLMNKYFPESNWTDFLVKLITFTKYFLAIQVFIHYAIVPDWFHLILNKIYSIWLIILFLVFITWLTKNFLKKKIVSNKKLNTEWKTLFLFLEKFLIALIWVIWWITIFDNLGYNISAFIAWAWIWGLAIAFAAQKSIANIFWAITILMNKPFKYWDTIKINWMVGKVDSISLSHVRLVEKSGHAVFIPNDAIISWNIENYSTRHNRRTEFVLAIDNKTPTTKIEEWIRVIEDILQQHVDAWTMSSYRVNFDTLGQFSIKVNVLYFSLLNKDFWLYMKQKEDINFEVKKALEKLKIKMADSTWEFITTNLGTTTTTS